MRIRHDFEVVSNVCVCVDCGTAVNDPHGMHPYLQVCVPMPEIPYVKALGYLLDALYTAVVTEVGPFKFETDPAHRAIREAILRTAEPLLGVDLAHDFLHRWAETIGNVQELLFDVLEADEQRRYDDLARAGEEATAAAIDG